MNRDITATIALLAGLASSVSAAGEPAPRVGLVPLTKAGVLYINIATGERSLSLYNLAEPEPIDTHGSAALFDYWMSVDENPCWDDPRADGFGWTADITGDLPDGLTEPIAGFDFGDLPFDSRITGIILTTATLATEDTDSNADGVLDSGIDTVAAFYDALSEGNRASIAPPTAVVRVEAIPGSSPEAIDPTQSYQIIVDFGGEFFELGDSDGQGRGSMWLPGAAPGLDVVSDGLADIQYLQHYTRHDSNDKVTEDSTFIALGSPDGEIVFTTYTTTITTITGGHGTAVSCLATSTTTITCTITLTNTFLIPDALPEGQSAFEGFGVGMLSPGGDVTNIDWSYGGCCFWFGGIDCAGFLDQVELEPAYNQSWYNFSPYAQNALGLFNSTPPDPCLAIDFNADGFLDHGDIRLFIAAKLGQDLSIADVNGDGVCDNGDIGAFVSIFLSCTG